MNRSVDIHQSTAWRRSHRPTPQRTAGSALRQRYGRRPKSTAWATPLCLVTADVAQMRACDGRLHLGDWVGVWGIQTCWADLKVGPKGHQVACVARLQPGEEMGVVDIVLFFFNDTATTEIYTLSLHDALPI